MATRRLESFTTYGTSKPSAVAAQWAELQSGTTLLPTSGRSGRGAVEISLGNSSAARIGFGGNVTTILGGFAMILNTSLPGNNTGCRFSIRDNANATQLAFVFNSDGSMTVWRGALAASLATSAAGIFGAGGFFYLEFKAVGSNTVGAIEVRLNGVTIINVSGVDTFATAVSSYAQMAWENNSSGAVYRVGDIHLYDTTGAYNNDFIGDHSVLEDVANADGALNDWTPLSGSDAFAMVDEIPYDGDTSYISSSTPGDRQSLGFPAISTDFTGIACVEYFHISRKDGPGPGSIQAFALSNGTEGAGDDDAINETYSGWGSFFATDPDTGLPWTRARAEAAEVILERTA